MPYLTHRAALTRVFAIKKKLMNLWFNRPRVRVPRPFCLHLEADYRHPWADRGAWSIGVVCDLVDEATPPQATDSCSLATLGSRELLCERWHVTCHCCRRYHSQGEQFMQCYDNFNYLLSVVKNINKLVIETNFIKLKIDIFLIKRHTIQLKSS